MLKTLFSVKQTGKALSLKIAVLLMLQTLFLEMGKHSLKIAVLLMLQTLFSEMGKVSLKITVLSMLQMLFSVIS